MSRHQNPLHRPRPSRLRWLAVAAVTAAAAIASSAATAGAQTDTQEPVDVAVASYASDYSVTHTEAQRRLDRIHPLQDILTEIRSHETARLAGWGIDHTGTFTGWVWLIGNLPPSTAASRIANAHTDVEIRIGATHTLAELLEAEAGLFRAVGPTGHVTGGPETLANIERMVTFTGIDMGGNAVRIGIDPGLATAVPGGLTDPGPVAVTDEEFQAKVIEVTKGLQDSVEVRFTVVDGRGRTPVESFAGGDEMGECTSGFAARESGNGAYGMITAGHCGADGPNDSASQSMHGVPLPFVNGWVGTRADAQFHKIPTGASHVLLDDYRCSSSYPVAYCDVSGDRARSDMLNSYVCHAGKNSGVSCGKVTDINYRPRQGRVCYLEDGTLGTCKNVFVEATGNSLKSCRGDSGAPFYWSGIAYGIAMSGTTSDDCNNTGDAVQFSAIREVEDFLDVNILFTHVTVD